MKKCPRTDCDLDLLEDDFYPPGAFRCPKHGGPIWNDTELFLATELEDGSCQITELETLTNIFSRLCRGGGLKYSVAHDLSGISDAVVTIENHGPESIDVQFYFDSVSGMLMDVKCFTDRRK